MASMQRITADIVSPRPQIMDAHERAFREAVILFQRKCTEIISRPRFWEGYPGIRDIVDTGQLRAAARLVWIEGQGAVLEGELQWLTEYAAAVHNGAIIRYANGTIRVIPTRAWTKIAEEEFNFEQTYIRLFNLYARL